MKPKHIIFVASNLVAVLVLMALLAAPFYFAGNVTKLSGVAGQKTTAKFFVVSQISRFPDLTLEEHNDSYKITFKKIAKSQAFTGLMLITNPTGTTQKYTVEKKTGSATVFFGDDINSLITEISLPSSASVPISILSQGQDTNPQSVEFAISTN